MRGVKTNTNPYPEPPITGSAVQRKHIWQHLDTQYLCRSNGYSPCATYKRIDRFYCTNCCDMKEIIKEERLTYQPDWFDSRQARIVIDR